MIHNSDPDDDNGIADKGTEDKKDTPKHPDDNSCDIVSIFRSVGDDIVERVDQNKDRGDDETTPGSIGSGRDEETDPGDDDEHGGGKVVHQDVHLGLPGQLNLETSN